MGITANILSQPQHPAHWERLHGDYFFFDRREQKYVSCGPFEQVQDSSRSEIASPVGETATDGQKQNWQVAFPS